MKKYLLFFLLFTSCIKIENNIPNSDNMNGFIEITICNDYNNTAYVVSNNDTIAVVSTKTTIIVPKNYNYDITYCDCSSENYNKYNQLLCFEDLLKG